MDIGTKWRIESDSLNVTLLSRHVAQRGKTAGQEVWTAEGYYSTVASALEGLVEHAVKETHLKDLKTVVAKIDELKREIREALPSQNVNTYEGV